MPGIEEITATIGQKYAQTLKEQLLKAPTLQDKYDVVVNTPFIDAYESTKLDLGIVVLLLVNRKDKTIDRIALSDTEPAQGAVNISTVPFAKIRIPLKHKTNAIAQAVATKERQVVADWKFLFVPAMDEVSARHNQSGAGIGSSLVYPLIEKNKGFGAMIFSFFQPPFNLRKRHFNFAETYSQAVADALPDVMAKN